MENMHQIPDLDAAGLRKFGITFGLLIAVIFGLLLPYLFNWSMMVWPWLLGSAFVAWGLLHPSSLRSVYRNWMKFGLILNRIVSPVILGLVFFFIVTPMGLIMRVAGKNPMNKQEDSNSDSLRVKSTVRDARHLENPY